MRVLKFFGTVCLCLTQLCAGQDEPKPTDPVGSVNQANIMFLDVQLHDVSAPTRWAVIDTGAQSSFTTYEFVESANLTHLLVPAPDGTGSNWGTIKHFAIIDIFVPDARMPNGDMVICRTQQRFAVIEKAALPGPIDLLLGGNFLAAQQATIVYADWELVLGKCGGAHVSLGR